MDISASSIIFSWKFPVCFAAFFVLSIYIQRWYSIRCALHLGALSPTVKIRGPWGEFIRSPPLPGQLANIHQGLGFFWNAIKTWRNNTVLEFWESIFEDTGCTARGSYTAEVNIMDGQRMILTADPENIKAMLATDFKSWGKGKILYNNFKHFLGDGILSVDGEKWHGARQIMRPFFEKSRVADLDLYERNVQRLIPILSSNEVVEIDDLIFRYTLDAISEFLLGSRVGSLENQLNGFTEAFNEVQRVQSVIMRAGYELYSYLQYQITIVIVLTHIDHFLGPYRKRLTLRISNVLISIWNRF
jgi:Cytochrome P450